LIWDAVKYLTHIFYSDIGERKVCRFCDMTFSHPVSLSLHLIREHEIPTDMDAHFAVESELDSTVLSDPEPEQVAKPTQRTSLAHKSILTNNVEP